MNEEFSKPENAHLPNPLSSTHFDKQEKLKTHTLKKLAIRSRKRAKKGKPSTKKRHQPKKAVDADEEVDEFGRSIAVRVQTKKAVNTDEEEVNAFGRSIAVRVRTKFALFGILESPDFSQEADDDDDGDDSGDSSDSDDGDDSEDGDDGDTEMVDVEMED